MNTSKYRHPKHPCKIRQRIGLQTEQSQDNYKTETPLIIRRTVSEILQRRLQRGQRSSSVGCTGSNGINNGKTQ